MATLSKIGFYLFSGALGAAGIAAGTGALDTAPWGLKAPVEKVAKTTPGAKEKTVPEAQKVAALEVPEKAGAPEEKAMAPKEVFPTFDVLRVEKDGSTLIAGNAAPGSTVEIVIGDKVVATTTAGTNGDFVAILESPLEPGDHEISIRSTSKDNKIMTSLETGLVSVPKDKSGELLAMVTKPGEASRILQKPSTETAKAEEEKPVAKAPTSKEDETKVAILEQDKESASTPAAKKAGEGTNTENNAADGTEKVVVQTKDKTDETAIKDKPEDSKPEPQASADVASSDKPENAEEKPAGGKTGDATVVVAGPKTKTAESQTAKSVANTSEPAVEKKLPTIVVEAVEVEGARIFVAGAAEPGRRIAIYIDNKLLGYAKGTHAGRFLLEVDAGLAPGFHSVRADVYDVEGINVASRAEVPLVHEPRPDDTTVVADAKAAKAGETALPAKTESKTGNTPEVTDLSGQKADNAATENKQASKSAETGPANMEKGEQPEAIAKKPEMKAEAAATALAASKKAEAAAAALAASKKAEATAAALAASKKAEAAAAALAASKKVESTAAALAASKKAEATAAALAASKKAEATAAAQAASRKAEATAAALAASKKAEATAAALAASKKAEAAAAALTASRKAEAAAAALTASKKAEATAAALAASKKAEATAAALAASKKAEATAAAQAASRKAEAAAAAQAASKKAEAGNAQPDIVDKAGDRKPAPKEKPTEVAKAPVTAKTGKQAEIKTVEKPVSAPSVTKDKDGEKKKVEVASLDNRAAIETRPIHTGSSVIIRRGDSLWRISYRTYGRGIRYSTIYEANLKQLKNPNRIYPGQILRVPKMKFDKDG